MNRRAVHSCKVTKECLSETKKPALEPYPRGSTNQLTRPVTLNKENKKKDMTFTIHCLDCFPAIFMVPLSIVIKNYFVLKRRASPGQIMTKNPDIETGSQGRYQEPQYL